jgi:chemotaxis protein methyltransferase CheR
VEPSLAQIAALVSRRAGLDQARHRPWLLESRVAERRRALRCASARGYLELLEGPDGEGELERLLEALRVGETRFFRQPAHLRALRRVALPELAARVLAARRPPSIRAWSAGCASGEEPYSVAMVLMDWAAGRAEAWRVEVLATDLSPEALTLARAGHYNDAALADLPGDLRRRHLAPHDGGHAISPELRRVVRFERRNLMEQAPGREPGFDLIFCCNVLIYLEREAQRRVLERLVAALHPGGYLFLGSAESTGAVVPAVTVALTTPDGTVFQRAASAAGVAERVAPPAPVKEPPASTASVKTETETEVEVLALEGSYDEPTRLKAELRGALERSPAALIVDLDSAAFLDPGCARVLHRAAMTLPAPDQLALVASQPGVSRWLQRQPLLTALPRTASRAAARALLTRRPEAKR